jgi:hypothetical protein
MNQSAGHWLLFHALNSIITISFKTREEVNVRPFEFLMDDDLGISFKLASFALNIKFEVFWILDSFLSFMRTYNEKKAHNMLALMFDLRFKSLHLVSSYVSKEQGVSIIKEYDRRALYPMLIKSYNHLHPIVDGGFSFVDQDADQNYGLDIFQMTSSRMKTMKEIIPKGLLDVRRFHVDLKEIKNPFQCWEKHESRFPILAFLARQILGIVG